MAGLTAAIVPLSAVGPVRREEALAELARHGAGRLMLTDAGQYLGVVSKDRIAALATGSLVTPAAETVPRVWVDDMAELNAVTVADVEVMALLVGPASGLVVDDGTRPGFLSWEALADALPVLADNAQRSKGLDGTPNSPPRCYVCRRCDPPLRRLPRQGWEAPVCPVNLLHGRMEREVV